MKGKLLKKIIAGVATLAMAAQLGLVLPASAATGTYLSMNFDDKATANANAVVNTEVVTVNSNDSLNKSGINFDTQKNAAVIGSGHTGPVTLATFTEAIGKVNEDLDIEFKMAKRQNGETHSLTVSFDDASDNTLFGIQIREAKNGESRSVYLLSNSAEKKLGTYSDNAWATYNLYVGYISAGVGYIKIGDTVLPYNASAVKKIVLKNTGNTQDRDAVVDDVKLDVVTPATASYLVTYDVEGVKTYEAVAANGHPEKAPTAESGGMEFAGWTDGETTSKNLSDFTITKNTTLTATFQTIAGYVEALDKVEITGDGLMTIGADQDTDAANVYTAKLTGVDGTVITKANLASNANLSISWEIDGFKTANDEASGNDNLYCDGYGNFVSKTTDDVTATFNVRKNATMNFFGKLTATVTYGKEGETPQVITASKYVAAIMDDTAAAGVVLPKGGFPSDFDTLPDSFEGYNFHLNTMGDDAGDEVFKNWYVAGSDVGRSGVITKEGANKFVKLTSANTSKSHTLAVKIDKPDKQTVFEQYVRFNNTGGQLLLTNRYPYTTTGNGTANPISVVYDGGKMKLNGTVLLDASGNEATFTTQKWYKVVFSADPVIKKGYAYVYDGESGDLVGSIDNVAFTAWKASDTQTNDTFTSQQTWFSVGFGSGNTGTIDFDRYRAFNPTADQSKLRLTPGQESLSIPRQESTTLEAQVVTSEGYPISGTPTWNIEEDAMKDVITLTPDASNPYKATVAIADGASEDAAGVATISYTIGGYNVQKELQITSSADTISFTSGLTSLSIPLEDGKTTTTTFAAIVQDMNLQNLNKEVTIEAWNKAGTEKYTTAQLADGVTFDAATGEVVVTSDAKPFVFQIKASGENSKGQTITRSLTVNVHGLAFDFGYGTDADVEEGFVAVASNTSYTESRGYGLVGSSVTAGGTEGSVDASADYLEGNLTFKTQVQAKQQYNIKITYTGNLTVEPVADISDFTAGQTLGSSTEATSVTYDYIPVMDGDIELSVTAITGDTPVAARVYSIEITKSTPKTPVGDGKPVIFTIGDSTIANQGSWAYHITHNQDDYADLYAVADFQNQGRGGSNLLKYFTSGDLINRVLRQIKPGDYVMIGDMGTNGGASTPEADYNYYIDACELAGAKIILNSYSPHGGSDYYDATTKKFNGIRYNDSNDPILRKIAVERAATDENYVGFIDIGAMGDRAFTAYARDYAGNKLNTNTYESVDEAAAAIYNCYGDHNHYGPNGKDKLASTLICRGYEGVSDGVAGKLVKILTGTDTTPDDPANPMAVWVKATAGAGNKVTYAFDVFDSYTYDGGKYTDVSETVKAYVAEYTDNVSGQLSKVDSVSLSESKSAELEFEHSSATPSKKVFVWYNDMTPVKNVNDISVTAAP